MRCAECGGKMCLSADPIEYKVRGESYLIDGISHYKCQQCGEEELSLQEMKNLSHRADEAFREKHALLSPKEIRAIREFCGLKQQDFEKILGAGATVVSRWESGAIMQPAIADTLLKIIRDNPDVLDRRAIEVGVSLPKRKLYQEGFLCN